MKDLGITKGEWKLRKSKKGKYYFVNAMNWEDLARVIRKVEGYLDKEGVANAKLIVDAGNTSNKCGLLPSELLKQRNELLEVLEVIENDDNSIPEKIWELRNKAIQNTK
ncbi:hypothetical protein Phi10:1_gp014 [Cellulophaga phage phi10:1]|uniref:Uncharacterized protein n=1 Tax=Cellulophaga phage phi10:1 TaxID=1327981 RepID=S0A0L5_9CAUD|nr:hypothetical protein Phi10:1_gp014 [Cellulophaga phage phi10:1]AGO48355.1 hypothetical protein Phi10:1_gp014 [Cellulophaga phage phi10:1]